MVCESNEEKVGKVYRKVCQGAELEKIKTTDEIKNIIITFSKCPVNQSAYEIHGAHPEISASLAATLRHIRKVEMRKKNSTRGEFHTAGIGEVVRLISLGVPKSDIKKSGVTDPLYKRADRFIRMALKNTKIEIISEKLRLSDYTVKRMLETFNQKYRRYFENKEEKIILEA